MPSRQLAPSDTHFLNIFGVEKPRCQSVFGIDQPIDIGHILVSSESCRLAEQDVLNCAVSGTGNVVAAVRVLDLEEIQSHWIDVGPIARNLDGAGYKSVISNLTGMILRTQRGAQSCPEAGGGTVTPGDGIQFCSCRALGGHSIELAGSLIATKEEQLVLLNRPTK